MNVTAILSPGNSHHELDIPDGSTVMDILKMLELRPDAHIVLLGSKPIPVDNPLQGGETLNILKVASGG